MTGRLRIVATDEPQDQHTHVVFDLAGPGAATAGDQLRFHDVRKFGRMYLVDEAEEITAGLGPEPLDAGFTLGRFRELLARRSGRLKPLLLNQAFLAGLGNIYADESLFEARLGPLRKADTLTEAEQERLYRAVRSVLARAVRSRGTTLTDQGYVDARGQAGAFQGELAVYGRRGKACRVCGTEVARTVLGGRSTHYCPACQA
jgi:formamidopyrimidine-DNA glycosylase